MTGHDERLDRAEAAYERTVFGGDPTGLDGAAVDLDGVAADLELARGRLAHARFLTGAPADPTERDHFERALTLHRGRGDVRGEAEALLWLGLYQQVVTGDHAGAVAVLRHADELAVRAGDDRLRSYALRHLGIAAHAAGDLDQARRHLTASTDLRRRLDFPAGVAANLVGLAYLSLAQGRPDEARSTLDEAATLATAAGADRVRRDIDEARAAIG